jgi:predicted Zn finger-like uncharacterized protein
MIVKCEQCQTRFKIPDEKVTEKGVKVRCTKCTHTFRVMKPVPARSGEATEASLDGPSADPFARFGSAAEPESAEVTRPGVFALGVEATREPEVPQRAAPITTPAPTPFDFSSLAPPAAPSAPPFAALSAPPAPGPFDLAAIAPSSSQNQVVAPSAFDFESFGVGPAAPAQPPPLPSTSMPSSAFDFAPPVSGAPATASFPAFDFAAPLPAARPASSAPIDDGFLGASSPMDVSEVDGAAARAMFDLPPPAATLDELPARNRELKPAPSAPVSAPRSIAPQAVSALVELPPKRPGVFGVVVNVVIALGLVLASMVVGSALVNEGKVTRESLSFDALKATFAPSVEFVVGDVSNGLYETNAGRSVFFVRGEVVNRSQAPVRVVVKAEIIEDGAVVRSAESLAGEPATPEELYRVDSSEALEALNRKVDRRAVVLAPESSSSFVVPFREYPPELKGFRVKVSARAAGTGSASAKP